MAEIKHQIPIDASPDKVYAALATPAGLRGWWTADVRADEKVDGKAEFVRVKKQLYVNPDNDTGYFIEHEPGQPLWAALIEKAYALRFTRGG